MDESSLYLCGFNGFGQINQFCKDCRSSQNNTSNHMYYSSPQKSVVSDAVRVVSTWSKICVITCKGHLYVGGLKHRDDNVLYSNSDQVSPDTAVTCDNFTIFKRNPEKLCLMAEGEITVQDLDITEKIQVKEVVGCDKELAVVSEDQHIYSGSLHQLVEGPVKLTMTLICGNLKIQSVSCGKEHVLLLSYTGEVYSYGRGSRGQLGYGDLHVDQQTTPLPVETLSGLAVTGIAAGGWHSTAITGEGDLYVWGWNESGQLGLTNGKRESKELDSTLAQSNTKITSAPEKTISSYELQPENIENLRMKSDTSFLKEWDIRKSGQSVNPTFLQFDRSGNTMAWNTRHSRNEGDDVSAHILDDKQTFIKTCDDCQSKNVEKSQSEVKSFMKAWNKQCSVDSDQNHSHVSVKTDFVTALTNSNLEKPAIQVTDKPSVSKACNSSSRESRNQDLSDIGFSRDSRNQDLSDIRSKCSMENEKLYPNAISFTEAWHNDRSLNAAHNNSEAKKQKFSNSWNTDCSVRARDTDLDINERPSLARNMKGHISAISGEQMSNVKLHQKRMHFVFHQDIEPVQIQGVPQVLDLPEAVKVTKVSCGSRHTAVLLDNGCLMTTGWNGYGQLCHGDVISRDFLQTVAFFSDQQLVVTNVFCDIWTTAIIAQKITEC